MKKWWAAGVLAVALLFGNQGFRDWFARSREKRQLQQALAGLYADQERLKREWTLIQQDPSYTEYVIRKQLGYVKKGEVEYRLIRSQTPDSRTKN